MYHIHDFPVMPFATKYVIPLRGPCHSLQLAFPYLGSDNFKKRLKKKKKPLWSWVGDGSVSRVKGEEGPELDT